MANKKTPPPIDLIGGKEPNAKSVAVCMKPALFAELDRLSRDLETAIEWDKLENDPAEKRVPGVMLDIRRTNEEIAEQTVTFWFRSLPRLEFHDLVRDHPPRKGNPADEGFEFDTEAFPPALIAACSWKPPIDLDTAQAMSRGEGNWSDAEFDALFVAAWTANKQARSVTFTKRP